MGWPLCFTHINALMVSGVHGFTVPSRVWEDAVLRM